MAQSLFTSQTPATPDAIDGTDTYSMGTYLTPAVDGTITAIRWFFPLSAQPGGAAVKANLFRNSDQAKLGGTDAVFASPGTPGAWNQVALTTPVPVSAGVTYCATIRTPGRYVASSGGASPFPLTNGDLSALSGAGRFAGNAGADVVFPTNNFSNGCYFVDVVFDTGDTPAEGAAALGLDFAVSSTGGAKAEGSNSADLALALAATGRADHSAVVSLGLGLAVAASGQTTAQGTVALGLGLAPAAAGQRASQGAVGLGLRLAVSASGSNGDTGRPVKPWPYGTEPVSSFPWTPRPVKSFQEVNTP